MLRFSEMHQSNLLRTPFFRRSLAPRSGPGLHPCAFRRLTKHPSRPFPHQVRSNSSACHANSYRRPSLRRFRPGDQIGECVEACDSAGLVKPSLNIGLLLSSSHSHTSTHTHLHSTSMPSPLIVIMQNLSREQISHSYRDWRTKRTSAKMTWLLKGQPPS